MIAKQSIGSSFMGALSYNLKKMYNAEKAGQAELLATNFISLEKPVIKKEVDLVDSLNPRLKKNTYHTSLNFVQGERVSNEKMLEIAQEYMEHMGFDNNPYFIFRHHDSNHPHCHILALRTRFDGSTVSDSNNYKRSEKSSGSWKGNMTCSRRQTAKGPPSEQRTGTNWKWYSGPVGHPGR